jgi:hypothetical protein
LDLGQARGVNSYIILNLYEEVYNEKSIKVKTSFSIGINYFIDVHFVMWFCVHGVRERTH